MSLLGALSVIGLLIKNAVVLIDEIDQQIAEGTQRYAAILDSGVSRLRPVVLAAATTILGLIPLLQDVFPSTCRSPSWRDWVSLPYSP